MGTNGLIAFRYKGYYYIKYNQFDSYPDGLGQDLVNDIPASQERFEKWLDVQRNFCEQMASSGSPESDAYDPDTYEKSSTPPENDICIEWTYTYDLDNLAFVVDSKAHFSLRDIAREASGGWIPFISMDARGHRCLSLETPPLLVAKIVGSGVPFLGGDPVPSVDEFVPTSIISSSTWSRPLTPHHRRLMLAQVNASIAETYSRLSTFNGSSTSSVEVQEFAMSFLEAIVPNNQAIVANRRSPALATDHSAQQARSPWFWYRGCLILLVTNLDNNELFQVYVQAVTARAKAKNIDKCTALLWSVHHVAVVEVSGGAVSHSDPIPLLAAYGSDEEGFLNALHLLWHYLPYPRWRVVHERATSDGASSSDFWGFPAEIVMKIMAFSDQLDYPMYQFLSHRFFGMWWNQLRLASYTILRDAEEIKDTSLCFNARTAEELLVKLQFKFLWGKKTGNIWRKEINESDDDDDDDEPERTREFQQEENCDDQEFSQGSTVTKYRVQRFYSYLPEGPANDVAGVGHLPRVKDQFSSQTDILLCEAEPAWKVGAGTDDLEG